VRLTGVLGFPFEMQIVISSLILGGVLDEFPNLRFCFLEGGVGFFAHLMDRLTGDAYAWLTAKSEEERKKDQKMRDIRDAMGNREDIVKDRPIRNPGLPENLYLSVEVFEKLCRIRSKLTAAITGIGQRLSSSRHLFHTPFPVS
jgi:hypothetical protein